MFGQNEPTYAELWSRFAANYRHITPASHTNLAHFSAAYADEMMKQFTARFTWSDYYKEWRVTPKSK